MCPSPIWGPLARPLPGTARRIAIRWIVFQFVWIVFVQCKGFVGPSAAACHRILSSGQNFRKVPPWYGYYHIIRVPGGNAPATANTFNTYLWIACMARDLVLEARAKVTTWAQAFCPSLPGVASERVHRGRKFCLCFDGT